MDLKLNSEDVFWQRAPQADHGWQNNTFTFEAETLEFLRILFRDVQALSATENKLELLCDLWDVTAVEEHESLQGALHHAITHFFQVRIIILYTSVCE